ncbi:MAG: queuosine precursor transporter [Anaerolineales bacterium]|nr:queuosine precursor transporter [Anaerolineales bacterium]
MIATILVTASYIAAQMLADITSLKIVSIFGMSVDAGTLIYPLTFTIRDLVHKVAGRRAARIIILTAAVINLGMAGLFWIVSQLPYDPSAGPQPDWNAVLAPVWRIVIASILAEIFSELADTEIYHLWVTRITSRYQWLRVLVSNAVSVPMDSLIFVWAAFGGVLPTPVVWEIFGANILLKGAFTLISLPSIYLVREKPEEK